MKENHYIKRLKSELASNLLELPTIIPLFDDDDEFCDYDKEVFYCLYFDSKEQVKFVAYEDVNFPQFVIAEDLK